MSKRKKATHTGPHKYQRIKWKSRASSGEPYIIFKCMLPGCTHYTPKDLVVGNETICWRCGREFQMGVPHTYMAKPHCIACTKGKKGTASVDDVMSNLDRILGGI
jgi:hypothetical protein